MRRPLLRVGGAVAILSAVPGPLWQASHDRPQIEMTSVIAAEARQDAGGRPGFLPLVLFYAAIPVGVALAVRGVVRLRRIPAHRFLGITVGGVILAFLIADGRHTYTGGLSPLLFAAGPIGLRGCVWRVVAGAPGADPGGARRRAAAAAGAPGAGRGAGQHPDPGQHRLAGTRRHRRHGLPAGPVHAATTGLMPRGGRGVSELPWVS